MFNEIAKKLLKELYGEFDMDFAIKETDELTKLEAGQTFDDYLNASNYVYKLLKEQGFDAELHTFKADGKTNYQDKCSPIAWSATKGKLTVLSSPLSFQNPVIADFEKDPVSLLKHSTAMPEGGLRTRIVTEEQVWAGEDCRGALVLLHDRAANMKKFLDLGAIGLVCDYLTSAIEYPDCLYWSNACTDGSGWHSQAEDRDFIGFMVTPRVGKKLRQACSLGNVSVLVECDGRRYEGEVNAVTATLKGKTNKEFWLLAHLYEPFVDDNSMGVIGAITVLKAIRDLVKAGKLPEPNCTIRVLFAMEVYGFAALYEALGEEVTKNAFAGLNIDGILVDERTGQSQNYRIIYPPYSSPSFSTTFMKSVLEVYPEVFPNHEVLDKTIIRFVDDTFLGDSTTGVPTMWLFHSDKGETIQHNTCVDMSWVEESQFRRILSIFSVVTIASTIDVVPIKDMLDNALRHAQEAIVNAENRNLGDAFVSYVKNGEKQRILNFKTISDSLLIDEYANKINDTYIAYEGEMGKWQSYAKTIIPKRVHKGFPQDKLFLPREKRNFRLPDGILYGPYGLILSAMDGKKDLEIIIRECLWEHGSDALSDSSFKAYVLGVLNLANAGYLSVTELNPLTKDDLVAALRELGLKKTDIVALHSSLSACGHLQGGANALIEAFRECSNTLIAPTFTRPFIAFEGNVNKGKTFSPYDKNDISSVWTGAVPKAMLKMGAKRSNHATHSWCGLGEKTDELISAQQLLDPPTCSTSPLAYAHKAGGKIVLYGVSVGGLTFLHYLEDEANAAYLANAVVKIKNDDGSLTTEVIHRHLPGCRGFYGDVTFSSKIMRTLIAKGLEIKSVNFGIGKIMMIDMKQLYDLGMEAFREDKNATLCERPDCTFCRKFD